MTVERQEDKGRFSTYPPSHSSCEMSLTPQLAVFRQSLLPPTPAKLSLSPLHLGTTVQEMKARQKIKSVNQKERPLPLWNSIFSHFVWGTIYTKPIPPILLFWILTSVCNEVITTTFKTDSSNRNAPPMPLLSLLPSMPTSDNHCCDSCILCANVKSLTRSSQWNYILAIPRLLWELLSLL